MSWVGLLQCCPESFLPVLPKTVSAGHGELFFQHHRLSSSERDETWMEANVFLSKSHFLLTCAIDYELDKETVEQNQRIENRVTSKYSIFSFILMEKQFQGETATECVEKILNYIYYVLHCS